MPAPMRRKERRLALALAERLLTGIGDGVARVDLSERVIHVRRPLTRGEELLLPPDWAASEAIDIAGEGGFLDWIARQ